MDDVIRLGIGLWSLMVLVSTMMFGYDGFLFTMAIGGVYLWTGLMVLVLMAE